MKEYILYEGKLGNDPYVMCGTHDWRFARQNVMTYSARIQLVFYCTKCLQIKAINGEATI